jgi:hypothetical protein
MGRRETVAQSLVHDLARSDLFEPVCFAFKLGALGFLAEIAMTKPVRVVPFGGLVLRLLGTLPIRGGIRSPTRWSPRANGTGPNSGSRPMFGRNKARASA